MDGAIFERESRSLGRMVCGLGWFPAWRGCGGNIGVADVGRGRPVLFRRLAEGRDAAVNGRSVQRQVYGQNPTLSGRLVWARIAPITGLISEWWIWKVYGAISVGQGNSSIVIHFSIQYLVCMIGRAVE